VPCSEGGRDPLALVEATAGYTSSSSFRDKWPLPAVAPTFARLCSDRVPAEIETLRLLPSAPWKVEEAEELGKALEGPVGRLGKPPPWETPESACDGAARWSRPRPAAAILSLGGAESARFRLPTSVIGCGCGASSSTRGSELGAGGHHLTKLSSAARAARTPTVREGTRAKRSCRSMGRRSLGASGKALFRPEGHFSHLDDIPVGGSARSRRLHPDMDAVGGSGNEARPWPCARKAPPVAHPRVQRGGLELGGSSAGRTRATAPASECS
jgi:hypothetical protein